MRAFLLLFSGFHFAILRGLGVVGGWWLNIYAPVNEPAEWTRVNIFNPLASVCVHMLAR